LPGTEQYRSNYRRRELQRHVSAESGGVSEAVFRSNRPALGRQDRLTRNRKRSKGGGIAHAGKRRVGADLHVRRFGQPDLPARLPHDLLGGTALSRVPANAIGVTVAQDADGRQ
jgi:hypothetical protein